MVMGVSATEETVTGGNPDVFVGPKQEGVILSGGGYKRKKRLALIIVLVLFVVIIAVFLVVLKPWQGQRLSQREFNVLKEYLETGDGSEENAEDDGNSLIFAVSIFDEDESTIENYYEELESKEKKFFASINSENESFGEYRNSLKVLKNAINHANIRTKLIEKYSAEGKEGAQDYFNEAIDCAGASSELRAMCSLETSYYNAVIDEYIAYKEAGCEVNGYYDIKCGADYYGADVLSEKIRVSPRYYLAKIKSGAMMARLSDEILRLDEAMAEILKK